MGDQSRFKNWKRCGLFMSLTFFGVLTTSPLQPHGALASNISSTLLQPATNAVIGEQTIPPAGWMQLCRDYGRDARDPCTLTRLSAVNLMLDAKTLGQLVGINLAVNTEIAPVSDMEHWRTIDKWSYPDDGKGDCEDYALEKRERLMRAGLPRQALLITVVHDKRGEGHAVLLVKTDQGDFILDNQSDEIKLWSQTDYKFLKRQSQESPNIWVEFQPGMQQVALLP